MKLPVTIAAFLVTLPLHAPAPAAAQDVQYETVTKVDFPGALGTAMRVAARLGGGSMETVEKTTIKGRRMRTDEEKTSTIMDLEGMRMIMLDHEAKTYSILSFDEMVAQARRAAEQVKTAADERQAGDAAAPEASFEFRFSVEDAKQRQKVAGYDAARFFLTMEAEGEYVVEETGEKEKGGTLVVLTDMWSSKDIPVLSARGAFDQATAREYADAGAALTQGIAAAFADDPRLKVAFDKSMTEARKIEGMAVRTVTTFVSVAPDKQFDRVAVTDPQPKGPSVAAQAGRSMLRGIAGRAAAAAGQQQQQQEEQRADAPPPSQVVMLSVTSEIRNVNTRNVDPKVFEVPAGYREVKLGGM